MPSERPNVIRFGVFEADLAGRTLRKSGIRVRLQEKPFRVLAMLLAKPGEVVTREELKAELAAGRPVILWVVGHVKRGTPVPYSGSDGSETIVAKFEHTVIAIGYTENKIRVLDGYRKYDVNQKEFMKSWNVLENLAVVWIE